MPYLFPDVEITGTDPDEDFLLEVAWVLTDDDFQPLTEPQTFLVDQMDRWTDMWARLRNADPIVQMMHAASGLTQELKEREDGFANLDEIYSRLHADLVSVGHNELVHLAGMSVHFDKSFLIANDFGGLFWDSTHTKPLIHHRMLDLSSLKLLWQSAGIGFEQALNVGKHRALNDVYEGISQARIFRDQLRRLSHPDVPEAVSL